ncbi:MAG: hypothetical protein GY727_08225 [Gammaproteobacteria bacterium]|nr:hypothetical protein [Gammaproteobacteria bacterium]MCP4088714.1 hypothetical protein [Gammaproteobacteria bacterium]MCP4275243.1 hypothetical protein [Gammaproteobacteria bacterium]MCP4830747.1 hypothetical protein [Gammaproteobacteria bacterium]MCP4929536.1 hypothetical protein [Gammaproteobacteria bacterium]
MKHIILILILSLAQAASEPANVKAGEIGATAQNSHIAYGGRLFDMWYEEVETDFEPDNPETPLADGSGGPNGDGTLNNAAGSPILNSGHSYRLKNLFGWDLRGDAGIYGHNYQAKEFILSLGPLSPQYAGMTRAQWIQRLTTGEGNLPAYGDVLNQAQIEALVDYMLAIRDRKLPYPDDLYALSVDSPKGFVLAPGGDATAGHKFYQEQCAECHGEDAANIIFDNGEQTLGMHARYYGYAIAMITLVGEPGSDMGPQISANLSVTEQTKKLLDLLAALCDRTRYPRGNATDPDVPDNDPRCGTYLR